MAIFPANKASLVQVLIDLMHVKPDPNQPIRIEVVHEDSGECLFVLFIDVLFVALTGPRGS